MLIGLHRETEFGNSKLNKSFERARVKIEEFINLSSIPYQSQNKNNVLTKLKPWITRGLITAIRFREN